MKKYYKIQEIFEMKITENTEKLELKRNNRNNRELLN